MGASIVLALAITAVEVVVAGWMWPRDAVPAERPVAVTLVVERAAPTPRPTPRPPHVRTPTPAPAVRATPVAIERAASPRTSHPVVHRVTALAAASGARSVARSPGQGAGAERGAGAGAGAGTGTDAGTGADDATGGTGAGAIDAGAPCGYVEFVPDDKPRIVGNVAYETIRATVHYPDGHVSSDDFPYPWVYTDYMETDPWSPMNVGRSNLVAFAQLPPPGTDTSRYSELIRYILDHTNANGGTVLQPCPH
jgi:hypothetical protein